MEKIKRLRKEIENLAYCANGKGEIVGGPYTDEPMRGPNVEKYELVNKFTVLKMIDDLFAPEIKTEQK